MVREESSLFQQIEIPLGAARKKCVLGRGFYVQTTPTRTLHTHNYAEIHVVAKGNLVLLLDGTPVQLTAGDVVLIPENTFHMYTAHSDDAEHTAFLVESTVPQTVRQRQPVALLAFFMEAVRSCEKTGDMTPVVPYLSLLCGIFFPEEGVKAQTVTDHAFVIHSYISRHYDREPSVEELAGRLHFSPRQTARLVRQHTGMSFKEAVLSYRMAVARHLAEHTDLPLAKIAQKVGYSTYNGFWKAYTRYCREKGHPAP